MDSDLTKKLVALPKKEAREISEAVAFAKNEEAKARDFYQGNAQKTSDSEMKKAFEFLAKEEIEHFNALTSVEESLRENGKFAVVRTRLCCIWKSRRFILKEAQNQTWTRTESLLFCYGQ